MNRRYKVTVRLLAICFLSTVFYILSYAPFLRCSVPHNPVSGSFHYRSPGLYRPVEWLTVKMGTTSPLLLWARLCGSGDAVELQAWLFAQGIDDPNDVDVNWMSPK